jgi:hypothetical protein
VLSEKRGVGEISSTVLLVSSLSLLPSLNMTSSRSAVLVGRSASVLQSCNCCCTDGALATGSSAKSLTSIAAGIALELTVFRRCLDEY